MIDKDISAGGVIAGALWTAAVLTWGASWASGIEELGTLSIIIAAAAGTAQVRWYLIEQYQRIKTALTVISTVPADVTHLPRNR